MKSKKAPAPVLKIDNPAYDIAMIQLKYLRDRALAGLLSLDETRQYDILCKNINLINGDPTTIEASFKEIENEYSEAELVEAAVNSKQLEKVSSGEDNKE